MVLPRGGHRETRGPVSARQDDDVRRPTNTALWRRLWWKIRAPHDLMDIGGLKIDRTRKPHCAWLGPTGAGKSSAFATIRMDGHRPMLVATPDLSDPVRAAAARLNGFVWTACESTRPINFLIGEPTEVAERLTEVFRSGGTGAWKRAARRTTAHVIRDMDAERVPRSLKEIGERLREAVRHDKNLSLVCAGWVDRFLDLADQFGDSIGANGVDLAVLLSRGMTVVLDVDAFDHPSLGGDVVALGLAEAKRCASLVPGGFRLGFEEAGQLGERIDLAEPFHRAGRRRKIAVDDLTQAESDLNEGISANIGTRVYFAQELKSLQKVAADRLGVDYRELDPANMRDFSAWVVHGKIRRLVRFRKPPTSRAVLERPPSRTPIVIAPTPVEKSVTNEEPPATLVETGDSESADSESDEAVYAGPVQMPACYAWAIETFSKPRIKKQLVTIWERHRFPGGLDGCYESTYHVNNRGRPSCSFDGADWTTYLLTRALEDARLLGLDEGGTLALMADVRRQTAAGELTVDHMCENEVCDRDSHLTWEARGRNAELYHERKRTALAAD